MRGRRRRPRRTHLYKGRKGGPATRDAFGRVLEYAKGTYGVTEEVFYGHFGHTVMNGQSLIYSQMDLPGGGRALLTPNNINFLHPDWQGNSAIVSQWNQTLSGNIAEYSPFGQLYNSPNWAVFNDSNADMGSFLWDAQNRELHGKEGRWISPDPSGIKSANLGDPQSLNQYRYASNNPLSFSDPSGLNDENVADAPWNGPGMYGNGGWGGGDWFASNCILGNLGGCGPGDAFSPTPSILAQHAAGVEARFESIWATGWDPDLGVNWNILSKQITQKTQDSQREKIVQAIVQLVCSPGDSACAAMVESEVTLNQSVGDNGLVGGHFNFSLGVDIQSGLDLSGCFDLRCGVFDTLHFAYPGTVHMDTANPWSLWGLGGLIHAGADGLLGNTIFASGIPW